MSNNHNLPLIQVETTYNFRFVQIKEIGEVVKFKSYKGYENFRKQRVRCLVDLHKQHTKLCDFYFVGDYTNIVSQLEINKTYKFTFLITHINWEDKVTKEIKYRPELHVGGATPVNLNDIFTEITDITTYGENPEDHPEIKRRLEERLIINNYKNK